MKLNCTASVIRKGWDKKRCLVHARCCFAPGIAVATAQYLDVSGSDLFSGILLSTSRDGGKTFSEFVPQPGLAPITEGEYTTVACDATPMLHKKTGKILLIGHTAEYKAGASHPTGRRRYTFYSVYDPETNAFSPMRFLEMPAGFTRCGSGCCQCAEREDGSLLIPVYYSLGQSPFERSRVLLCDFDGEMLSVREMGDALTVTVERGLCEPSVVFHGGRYYLTLRNDECGFVAESPDGLHYSALHLWRWDDGSIVDTYNTQQHFLTVGGDLYLVYTRRGADNGHVFRHRAPLFCARVENMRLVRDSEIPVVPERGARLGNFGTAEVGDGRAAVMAAEWMQPAGCEAYGSENAVWLAFLEK